MDQVWSTYLVNGCQVAMRVCEGGVDSDGFIVTPDGRSGISYFLKSVAQVGVSVCKSRLNANGLSIML